LNREIIKLRENVDGFSKELGMAAKAEDLKALSKYLDLWEPVEFLTRKQAESMIKEAKRKL
ncbi:hypothetical protein KY311_00535, partial [Candidatus Woesearchaeota archaeon]|nr:hypothetical protein [Candidatus Woesearchaeota archaeon]